MDPGENKPTPENPTPENDDRDPGSNTRRVVLSLALVALAGVVVTLVAGLIGALSAAHFA